MIEELLPPSISLEKLRVGLRESLVRGDRVRRKIRSNASRPSSMDADERRVGSETNVNDSTARLARRAHGRWVLGAGTAAVCGGKRRPGDPRRAARSG